MSSFEVDWLALETASMAVGSSGVEIERARSMLGGAEGALAGTPVDGAFQALSSAAVSVSASFAKTSTALSGALKQASSAYMIADRSAEAGMKQKRG